MTVSTEVHQATPQNFDVGSLNALPEAVSAYMLTFLDKQSLRAFYSVSHSVSRITDRACQNLRREGRAIIPASLPPGVDYTRFLLRLFPNVLGPELFREYFGEVEVVPVPQNLIEEAQKNLSKRIHPGCTLVYVPKDIPIEVGEDSPLMLEELPANEMLNEMLELPFMTDGIERARLIEDADRAPRGARKIQVPVTLNNIIFLVQKCLKKNLPSHFAGVADSSSRLFLHIHGNSGVVDSHYSDQKEHAIGGGGNFLYSDRVQSVQKEGLEIVPSVDRMLFHLLSYINSGKIPQNFRSEQTSDPQFSNEGSSRPLTITWRLNERFWIRSDLRLPDPSFGVLFTGIDNSGSTGAAVGIHAR